MILTLDVMIIACVKIKFPRIVIYHYLCTVYLCAQAVTDFMAGLPVWQTLLWHLLMGRCFEFSPHKGNTLHQKG